MEPKDITVRILEQIRDEIRATRSDLSARIEQTNTRIDRLDLRFESVEHVLLDLASQQRSTMQFIRDGLVSDFAELRRRVEVLEAKTG